MNIGAYKDYQVDCTCNLLGMQQIEMHSDDNLPHFGHKKDSRSDKTDNRTQNFAVDRKLSVSQIKRKVTPTKQKVHYKNGSDFYRTMATDESRKTLNNDTINIELPQRQNTSQIYQYNFSNNSNVYHQTKYGAVQKKYSIQTPQNNYRPLLPLRKVQSMVSQRKLSSNQTLINLKPHHQRNHQQGYLNNNTSKLNSHQYSNYNPQQWKFNKETPSGLNSQFTTNTTSLRNMNSQQSCFDQTPQFKPPVVSKQTMRLPKQSIAVSIFDNQTLSQKDNDKSLSEIGQSIVIQRPLCETPKNTLDRQYKYLKVPLLPLKFKQSLQNSRASHKEL